LKVAVPAPPLDSSIAIIVSITSLAVSTALAGLRVYEFASNIRHGLSAQMLYRWNVSDGSDDDLLILNASTRPINVYYIVLDWARPSWLGKWCPIGRKIIKNEYSSEDSFADFTIAAGGQHVSNFSEGSELGRHPGGNAQLLLSLSVVGRKRPVHLWIS
jgi:hypothetical protein